MEPGLIFAQAGIHVIILATCVCQAASKLPTWIARVRLPACQYTLFAHAVSCAVPTADWHEPEENEDAPMHCQVMMPEPAVAGQASFARAPVVVKAATVAAAPVVVKSAAAKAGSAASAADSSSSSKPPATKRCAVKRRRCYNMLCPDLNVACRSKSVFEPVVVPVARPLPTQVSLTAALAAIAVVSTQGTPFNAGPISVASQNSLLSGWILPDPDA